MTAIRQGVTPRCSLTHDEGRLSVVVYVRESLTYLLINGRNALNSPVGGVGEGVIVAVAVIVAVTVGIAVAVIVAVTAGIAAVGNVVAVIVAVAVEIVVAVIVAVAVGTPGSTTLTVRFVTEPSTEAPPDVTSLWRRGEGVPWLKVRVPGPTGPMACS